MVTAILGVVLGVASIVWQAATHVLSGGRAKVAMLIGAVNSGSMITDLADKVSPQDLDRYAEQGYLERIVAVHVANVGRLPITVTRWTLKPNTGVSATPMGSSAGKPLPHRLDVG